MTAPTTHEELVEWLAATMWSHWTKGENHKWDSNLLAIERQSFRDAATAVCAALDTFAVVCPREPTAHQSMLASVACRNVTAQTGLYTKAADAVLRVGIAASPFALKEPTDG